MKKKDKKPAVHVVSDTGVIVVAAGSSTRMGGRDKLFLPLSGKPVLVYSLTALQCCPEVRQIVVVTRREKIEQVKVLCRTHGLDKVIHVVCGGESRQQSVGAGLSCLQDCDYVAIHDGARPLLDPRDASRVIADAHAYGAAALGIYTRDTVKIADDTGFILQTPPRRRTVQIQTPQVFQSSLYRRAWREAEQTGADYTDDCQLVEAVGQPVFITQGKASNLKITTPEDLLAARGYLEEAPKMRIGHGYDVHRLTEGRKLILGGVEIPFEKGLLGHSDADVLTHAVMDALLGAAALGDIGQHFPDNDVAYKDADSIQLLEKVTQILHTCGYRIVNIDVTLAAEKPKVGRYLGVMRENIAHACAMTVDAVSVKATTEEGMGFTGAGEGMSATAVCLITGEESEVEE